MIIFLLVLIYLIPIKILNIGIDAIYSKPYSVKIKRSEKRYKSIISGMTIIVILSII